MILTELFFNYLIVIWIAIAIITFFVLLKITAPFGRHTKATWGPMIDNKHAWFIMEFSVLVVLYGFLFTDNDSLSLVIGIIVSFFTLHYLNRSIVFPFRIKTKNKRMPILIMFSAMAFNLINGSLLGYYLVEFAKYSNNWLHSPQFIIGTILFFIGMYINISSDNILINLRKPNETTYKIPQKKLFKYVSCPNIFGEIIEWLGFAILTWSLPGLAFFVWTVANLLPRALAHQKWYLEQFPDYPKERKALIPFIL